ncbi:hypothetical protein [Desulfosporosinus sp. OT]|nr:hypothetical protein [Desulfosporosinus sp. OT]
MPTTQKENAETNADCNGPRLNLLYACPNASIARDTNAYKNTNRNLN